MSDPVKESPEGIISGNILQSVDDKTRAALQELIDALTSGNQQRLDSALVALGAQQQSELYKKVGEMARSLHDAMDDFKRSLVTGGTTMASITLPDAAAKLEEVITHTYDAAQKTLACAEKQGEMIDLEDKSIMDLARILRNQTLSYEEFRGQVADYLSAQQERAIHMRTLSSQILMAQEFQDLTGQALKKVIKLVSGMESRLISLVLLFGGGQAEPAAAAAPEAKPKTMDQDDVDAVLSSFGF